MAISRPMPRWCWPSRRPEAARHSPSRSPAALQGRSRRRRRSRSPVRASSTSGSPTASGSACWRAMLERRHRLRPLDDRQRQQGQCRVCLGQSDRADACRPLPRRGGRRCAGQPARLRRLRRHQGILHQRRRRAGRRARPARPSCATARRWARTIGEIPAGLYPGDYLDAGRRRRWPSEFGTQPARRCRKTSGCRSSRIARSTR